MHKGKYLSFLKFFFIFVSLYTVIGDKCWAEMTWVEETVLVSKHPQLSHSLSLKRAYDPLNQEECPK